MCLEFDRFCDILLFYWHPGGVREFFDFFDAQVGQRRMIGACGKADCSLIYQLSRVNIAFTERGIAGV